jgi:hypothetical protein
MAVGEVHPSVEELAAFTLGTLGDQSQASIEAHVAACPSCQERAAVAPGDALVELLRSAHARTSRGADTFVEAAAQAQTPGPLVALAVTDALAQDAALSAPAASVGPEVCDALPPELAGHERYRVVRLLGAGGMGAVYEAEHRVMQRPVALKVIKRVYTGSAVVLERFRREVLAAARLSHPNIVTTYDAEDAGETQFLVMEYVEGTDLGRMVQERGPLAVDRACDYVRQAALGLQHAFEQGMVHRDLKPHNLMLTPGGRVKILDFGLACFASEAASAAGLTGTGLVHGYVLPSSPTRPAASAADLTGTGLVLGTVDYLAPEQADNAHQADVRSDVYSLGCTLYHLLAGRPPFPTGTPLQKVMAHVEKNPQPLSELRPDLPEGIMPVLERMMAKKPSDRYQTPAEVAIALEPFAIDQTVLLGKPSRGVRRRRLVAITTAILFLVVGLLGATVYRIATDKGELVITSESEDVEVVIKKGGKVVRVIDTKTKKEITLELRSGEYELELKGAPEGLKLNIEKVTLTRGKETLAKIERLEKKVKRVTGSELIKNGGFEAGIEGWGTWSHGPPSQFEFDRDVVKEGRQSLRVTASKPADCGCSQGVQLKPRQWYHFSGWVRTRGLKVHGAARVWGTFVIYGIHRPSEGPEWPILARGANHSGDTEWTRISLRFQAPDDGKASIYLNLSGWGRATGTAWFDGLKLVEETPPAR